MPLYETVMQEKPPVVLDMGTIYTKVGFAAEAYPRFIIPSEVYMSATGKLKKLFDYDKSNELYDQIVDFFQTIFFRHVLVSPKDRKIVLVESVFNPTQIREKMAEVLFRHFEVSSILFVPTHLVVLSTLAVDSAVVIDMGYKEISIMPVFSGIQVLHAFQAQPYGAEAIHNEIKRQLIGIGIDESILTETVLEDIKVRTCFVTTIERSKQYKEGNIPSPNIPDVDYPIDGKIVIKIPGKLRETALEILFPEDNDYSGLPYQILESILKCPIDMRKILCENIFLIGGTAMITGLMSRLKSELLNLLNSDIYNNKLFLKSIKFHRAPAKSNFTAWLGGSIYGGTDLVLTRSLTKESYSKCPRVPDWSNLDDNQLIAN